MPRRRQSTGDATPVPPRSMRQRLATAGDSSDALPADHAARLALDREWTNGSMTSPTARQAAACTSRLRRDPARGCAAPGPSPVAAIGSRRSRGRTRCAPAPAASPTVAAIGTGEAERSPPPRQRRSTRCGPRSPSTSTTARARIDLWERVRRGFAMPDLDNELVRKREQWYAARPDYVQRMTERGSRYLFHIVEELDKRGMPTELALLPFIESAFNPQAMSTRAGVGHVAVHARHRASDFELKQNIFRDDRRDVLASTRAALDYLQTLYGHVRRLAARAGRLQLGRRQRAARDRAQPARPACRPTTRACSMPAETRNYVPKLQAVKNIVARPAGLRPARCPRWRTTPTS